MTFLFKMRGPDDTDLGDYQTAVPGPWEPGDLLYDGGTAAWRITAVLEHDSSVYDGLWEVEPTDTTARTEG